MKKLVLTLLLVAVSCAFVAVPAQAATGHSKTTTLAKKHHHKKQHAKHKKSAKV